MFPACALLPVVDVLLRNSDTPRVFQLIRRVASAIDPIEPIASSKVVKSPKPV
jgi:hypothetical protein